MAHVTLCSQRLRRRTMARGGYTLVELLAGAASMAVLMTGIASAVLLATQALEDDESPSSSIRRTTLAMDEFVRDIACALSVQQSGASLTFTVPDRTGDGQNDTLTYAWSGVTGDPMTRQINEGTAAAILDNVHGMVLSYHMEPNQSEAAQEPNDVESPEQLLIGYEGTENLDGAVVTPTYWYGQYFKPSLPGGSTRWSVTKVAFRAKWEGLPLSQLKVQLRPATVSNLPDSTVLEEVVIQESSLGWSYTPWTEAAFSSVTGLAPTDGLCLVFASTSGTSAGRIEYQYDGVSQSNTNMVASTSGGSSWMAFGSASLSFEIYGTITAPDGRGVSSGKLAYIRASINAGDDPANRIDVAVQTINTPELYGP